MIDLVTITKNKLLVKEVIVSYSDEQKKKLKSERNTKWRENNPDYNKNWQKKNPKKFKKYQSDYAKTKKGKRTRRKAQLKYQKKVKKIKNNVPFDALLWRKNHPNYWKDYYKTPKGIASHRKAVRKYSKKRKNGLTAQQRFKQQNPDYWKNWQKRNYIPKKIVIVLP